MHQTNPLSTWCLYLEGYIRRKQYGKALLGKNTLAKSEGSLGIRELVSWNKSCSIKLIWILFSKACSIWIAWFIKNILSCNISNMWIIKKKQTHSSSTKNILRDYAYNWIKTIPRNGRNTRFWSDRWSPSENLKFYSILTSLHLKALVFDRKWPSMIYINEEAGYSLIHGLKHNYLFTSTSPPSFLFWRNTSSNGHL